jgi:hypothetical protein
MYLLMFDPYLEANSAHFIAYNVNISLAGDKPNFGRFGGNTEL